MARLARIVIPKTPHFITQRGNRGLDVFFEESDAKAYIDLMAEQCRRFGVEVWAYCLLRSRVHFLAVPEDDKGLALALGETHRRYTNRINDRQGWTGHLWQSRFSSFPLDEAYILPAAHFIEMMPVLEGISKNAASFRWSSAKAHLRAEDDELVATSPLLAMNPDWEYLLGVLPSPRHVDTFVSHINTGRPLGSGAFIERLEDTTGRALQKKKPGRKPKNFQMLTRMFAATGRQMASA